MTRSLAVAVVVALVIAVIVVSLYILLVGHNAPGGGFAGGLVAGMALIIRYLAAGSEELDEAAPVDAGRVLGSGLEELGRPRIDVTVRISGFFRDAFPHVVAMLDDAVQLADPLGPIPDPDTELAHRVTRDWVEPVRRADWCDVSFSTMRFGLPKAFVKEIGAEPVILLHDEDHGGELIAMMARFGRGLPA